MSKGAATRDLIVDGALKSASLLGLEQVTLGSLAKALKLSKSGLFAHFGSKEQLQLSVLQEAAERFIEAVVAPAIRQPRGEPRVRAMFENWLLWSRRKDMPGGCIFIAAAAEFDSRPGAVRDCLVKSQRDWVGTLVRAAEIAKEEKHFRPDLDAAQFAFEFQGLAFASHHHARLLDDVHWESRSRPAFEDLVRRARLSPA